MINNDDDFTTNKQSQLKNSNEIFLGILTKCEHNIICKQTVNGDKPALVEGSRERTFHLIIGAGEHKKEYN